MIRKECPDRVRWIEKNDFGETLGVIHIDDENRLVMNGNFRASLLEMREILLEMEQARLDSYEGITTDETV